jgi:hypothetical protein
MIVIAIPHLVQLAANYQALKSAKEEIIKQKISVATWAYSIGLAVQFVIGLLLFGVRYTGPVPSAGAGYQLYGIFFRN